LHAWNPTLGIAGDVWTNVLNTSGQDDLLASPHFATTSGFKEPSLALLDGLNLHVLDGDGALAIKVTPGGGTKLSRIAVIPAGNCVHMYTLRTSILARIKDDSLVILAHDRCGGAQARVTTTYNENLVLGSHLDE
jgi:hypothetical protein